MAENETFPSTVHEELGALIDVYCAAEDEVAERKADWAIRVKAESSKELDDDLRYLLVTHGPDTGLSPEGSKLLENIRSNTDKLFLITPDVLGGQSLGVFGRLGRAKAFASSNLYAFDGIPDDQPALWTGIKIVAPSALRFALGITSYYGRTGPFYGITDRPKVDDFSIAITTREAIVPHPVPYDEDPEGIVFTEPLSYYDTSPLEEHFACRNHFNDGSCKREVLVGAEDIKQWFDQYTKGDKFQSYHDILLAAEAKQQAT